MTTLAATRCLRILVVDADPLTRRQTCQRLTGLGHEVQPAAAGGEGLVRLAKSRYDVLITDIQTTGATGWDMARMARRACQETAVVLVAEEASVEVVERAQAQRLAVVGRPLDPDALETAIVDALQFAGQA